MANNHRIHVVLASDDNYFEGLLVTAVSIAQSCSRPNEITFHIMDGGISEERYAYLQDKTTPFGCELSRIMIRQNTIEDYKAYHGSKMTYARLLLPDLLPDVDCAIYSDVDILWHADAAELWDGLSPEAILHYVPPHPSSFTKVGETELNWFIANGFTPLCERYFNAGLIVMNLAKFRSEGLGRKMSALLKKHLGNVPQNDQTVLNAFMFDRHDVCPLNYK